MTGHPKQSRIAQRTGGVLEMSRSPQEEITPPAVATLVARHRDTIGLFTGASLVTTGVLVSDARLDATSRRIVIVSGLGLVYRSLGHGDAFPDVLQLASSF